MCDNPYDYSVTVYQFILAYIYHREKPADKPEENDESDNEDILPCSLYPCIEEILAEMVGFKTTYEREYEQPYVFGGIFQYSERVFVIQSRSPLSADVCSKFHYFFGIVPCEKKKPQLSAEHEEYNEIESADF